MGNGSRVPSSAGAMSDCMYCAAIASIVAVSVTVLTYDASFRGAKGSRNRNASLGSSGTTPFLERFQHTRASSLTLATSLFLYRNTPSCTFSRPTAPTTSSPSSLLLYST